MILEESSSSNNRPRTCIHQIFVAEASDGGSVITKKKRYRYLHLLLRLVYRDNSFRLQLVNKSAYGWHLAKSSGEFEMHSPNAFAACAHGFGCCGASDDGTLSVA
jgi:hypothetical protein